MQQITALIAVVLLTAAPSMVLGHPTPCNQGNDTMCLIGVREEFVRRDYFFGDGYAARCPKGSVASNFYCRNPDITRKTIASRLLKKDNFNTSTIKQFLRIRWNTPAGYYKACGHYFHIEPFAMDRDLDNTHTIYYDRWILSHRPAVAFRNVPGERYTLLAYDAGYLTLSGLWVNIQTGDTSTGEEVYPHLAPLGGMWEIRNPQVYALFRQTNATEIEDIPGKQDLIRRYIREHSGMYDASVFIEDNHLEGPIAVGYLVVKADAFSIQQLADRGDFNNCPYLNSKNRPLMTALEVIGMNFTADNYYRDYRGPFLRNLEMDMEILFHSPEAHFESCCKHRTVPAQQWTIDSLTDEPIDSLMLRYPPLFKLSPMQMDIFNSGMGKLYMLILLDITESAANRTGANTTIEWQVVNIPGDNIGESDTVVSYRPPIVKNYDETRTYALVLLRQASRIDHRFMWSYTNPGRCDGPDAKRCHFHLGMMEQYLSVRVASVATFRVKQDDYSRAVLYGSVPSTYSWSNMDEPMMSKLQACWYVDGFADPCPQRGCTWTANNSTHSHDQGHAHAHAHHSNSTNTTQS